MTTSRRRTAPDLKLIFKEFRKLGIDCPPDARIAGKEREYAIQALVVNLDLRAENLELEFLNQSNSVISAKIKDIRRKLSLLRRITNWKI